MSCANTRSRVLLVEDDSDLAESLQMILSHKGYCIDLAKDGEAGLELAFSQAYEAIVTDLQLPCRGGLELLREIRAKNPGLPVVVMTAHGTLDTAVEATKAGAFDYVVKPFKAEELGNVLHMAICAKRQRELAILEDNGNVPPKSKAKVVGNSAAMQRVFMELGRVAPSDVTVLIYGETGTGKELVAHAIYEHSKRFPGPYVAVNCAAIPEGLLESELFGHEKGAFTGAHTRRMGKFEQAHGGTLFLDEIGDIPLLLQVKLLRVLQEQTFQRVGGTEEIQVNVRIIAATNVDLVIAVEQGKFREDLLYRLNTVTLDLPPLREREGDIRLLVDHFNHRVAANDDVQPAVIPEASLALLEKHAWPGNVRQLESFVRRAVLACKGYAITEEYVTKALQTNHGHQSRADWSKGLKAFIEEKLATKSTDGRSLHSIATEAFEAEFLRFVYAASGNNKSHTAARLGIGRHTLRRKLHDYGLE